MRSLFRRKFSVQDIEREVTEQLETLVRTGKNPPPASWTLLGGLYGNERGADDPGADTTSPPAPADDGDTAVARPLDEGAAHPAAEEPVAEEPAAEEPAAEERVAEAPAAEERVAEAPAAEEPVAEAPAAEEVAEEPVVPAKSPRPKSGSSRARATRSGSTRSGSTRSGSTPGTGKRQRRSTAGTTPRRTS